MDVSKSHAQNNSFPKPDSLIAAITEMKDDTNANGDTYFYPAISAEVIKAQKARNFPSLTRREKEILLLIASNYSSKDIADNLQQAYSSASPYASAAKA